MAYGQHKILNRWKQMEDYCYFQNTMAHTGKHGIVNVNFPLFTCQDCSIMITHSQTHLLTSPRHTVLVMYISCHDSHYSCLVYCLHLHCTHHRCKLQLENKDKIKNTSAPEELSFIQHRLFNITLSLFNTITRTYPGNSSGWILSFYMMPTDMSTWVVIHPQTDIFYLSTIPVYIHNTCAHSWMMIICWGA